MMKTRRILALVVAAVLLVSTLCVVGLLNVTAAETDISDAAGLQKITGDGNYKLTQNIDLTGVDFTTIESFSGTLDGDGKTISGISAPLFATLSGTVKNLTLEGDITLPETGSETVNWGTLANTASNATVTDITLNVTATGSAGAAYYVAFGGIVGKASGTASITDCTVNGSISLENFTGTQSNNMIGAVVGTSSGNSKTSKVTISNCVNNATISVSNDTATGKGGAVAGIVGYADFTNVSYCVNNGAITGSNGEYHMGAIVGRMNGANNKSFTDITYCANFAPITVDNTCASSSYASGIVSYFKQGNIKYCYNTATITNAPGGKACGIIGYLKINSSGAITISNNYNYGTAASNAIGNITVQSGSATSSNNYYLASSGPASSKITNTAIETKEELNEALVALGEYVVDGTENDGYAVLKWQCKHTVTETTCVAEYCKGCGAKVRDIVDGTHAWSEWTVPNPVPACSQGEQVRECTVCGKSETAVIEALDHAWGPFVETTPATDLDCAIETSTCSYCGGTKTQCGAPANWAVTPVDGVYNIYTANDLLWLAHQMNKGDEVPTDADIALKADIKLPEGGMTYINKTFTGTFDGEGHTISGLNDIIFYKLAGTFKNVTLEGEIKNSTSKRIGTIAAETPNEGGAHISNVHSFVDIRCTTSGGNYGGIIGYTLGYNTIINCTYGGTLTIATTGSAIGGMVGYTNRNGAANPVIDGCVFDGAIVLEGDCTGSIVGGIYGHHNASNGGDQIKNCVVTGSITISEETTSCQIGGIAGGYRNTTGNTSRIENCVFNGTITGSGTIGAIAGNLTSLSELKNNVVLSTDYPISPVTAGTITNCYVAKDVVAKGNPITIGEVTYQKYNFGYLNVATKQIVLDAQELSATLEDKVKGYITLRDNGDKHDVRVIFVINEETVIAGGSTVTITFTKDGETVKTFTATLGGEDSEFEVFRAGIAAGVPYFAAEGSEMFGAIVNDIPDGEWDTIIATVVNGEETINVGSADYAQ